MTQARRIILVEDERVTLECLRGILAELGHQVTTATSGRQMIELARTVRPELIVADVMLPDIDGIDAAVEVNREREVPVLLITGHHSDELLARLNGSHIMGYLIKPVTPPELQAAVELAVKRFDDYQRARQEADRLKQVLEDRKLIERAKGSVMRRLRVDEEEAFRRLRKFASERNVKLVDVARSVLAAEEVFREVDDV